MLTDPVPGQSAPVSITTGYPNLPPLPGKRFEGSIAMLTTFTYAKGHEDGFDWFYPPWLLVGVARHRHVQLQDGPGLHLHSTNSAIATARFTPESDSDADERVVS